MQRFSYAECLGKGTGRAQGGGMQVVEMKVKRIIFMLAVFQMASCGKETIRLPNAENRKVTINNNGLENVEVGVWNVDANWNVWMEQRMIPSNKNTLMDRLSLVVPTVMDIDTLKKKEAKTKPYTNIWWVDSVEIKRDVVFIQGKGDTDSVCCRSGSTGAWMVQAQIYLNVTQYTGLSKVVFQGFDCDHCSNGERMMWSKCENCKIVKGPQ